MKILRSVVKEAMNDGYSAQESRLARLSAFRNDPPAIITVGVTALFGLILQKMTCGMFDRRPTPIKIYLSLVFAVTIVVFGTTLIQGTFFPKVDGVKQLCEDPVALLVLILAPVMVAIGFRFYQELFPTFAALIKRGIIVGDVKVFFKKMEKRHNSWIAIGVCGGIALSLCILSWTKFLAIPEVTWVQYTPIIVRIYIFAWFFLAWWVLLSFAYKVIVVVHYIQQLVNATEVRNGQQPESPSETGTKRARFSLKLEHPDGRAGFSKLSQLWLHVNVELIMMGFLILTFIVTTGLQSPIFAIFDIVVYILLGPLAFLLPFVRLHALMVKKKEDELEAALSAWHKATSKKSKDKYREQYKKVKLFPNWPFGWQFSGLFWGPYVLSPVLAITIQVLQRL